jgi:hypothetical protein
MAADYERMAAGEDTRDGDLPKATLAALEGAA